MRTPTIRIAGMRAPDNELYDRGCDLVEAAAAVRRAATSHAAVPAVPAVLGCVESALAELRAAAAALELTTAGEVDRRSAAVDDPRTTARRERMHGGYASLQRSLHDAEQASAAARALARRALDTGRASP